MSAALRRQTLGICCIAAPSAFPTRPPSSAAIPPGATRNSLRCAIAWPRAFPRAALVRVPGSPSWRATATPSPRCDLRWRGSAPCWCRSISCSSRRRRPSFSSTPAPKCSPPTPASPRSRARRRRARHQGARVRLAAVGGKDRAGARHDRLRRVSVQCGRAAAGGAFRQRSGAVRLYQRHRIAAEGRHAHPRRADLAICELRGRRRDFSATISPCRPALPLDDCAQLDAFLGPAIYVGGTNVITAEADAGQPAAADRAAPHHLVLRAADARISLLCCCCSTPRICPASRRAITAPRSCWSKYCAKWRGACPRCGCGIRPPDRNRAARHHVRAGRRAAQARLRGRAGANWKRAWSTISCATLSRARSARSCTGRCT